MANKTDGPYGEWCVVSVPDFCESGMAIATCKNGVWCLDTGEDVTRYVEDWKLAPIF